MEIKPDFWLERNFDGFQELKNTHRLASVRKCQCLSNAMSLLSFKSSGLLQAFEEPTDWPLLSSLSI